VSAIERDVDVVVIGMGPGGEHAAGTLAEAGLTVAGVESRLVGGECPYWGCIPSKMMIRAADLITEGRRIPGMAGRAEIAPDWAPVASRIRDEATDDWDDTVAADRFIGKGGILVRGHGRMTASGEVTVTPVGGPAAGEVQVLRARRGIVIASGTTAAVPPIPGLAGTPFWTNHEAIETERVPEALVVLGGGAVGTELAQVFARFGSRVSVAEGADRLLPLEEPEAGELLAGVFGREGITVRAGHPAARVAHSASGFNVTLSGGEELTGEALLVATGRRADLAAVGAGAAGIDEQLRAVRVDDHMRAAPGVWALGDITGKGAFTHMSMYQAGIVINDILGGQGRCAEYHAVPRVTFTDPEIGAVGLTERQAREAGLTVRTSVSQVPQSARGWIHKAGNDGFIKLVEDCGRGVLAGATSAGPWGGEVLGALAVAVHSAVPVQRLRDMIYAYPTFHRAIEDALAGLGPGSPNRARCDEARVAQAR
jgi:pyruvate/2-oxoglutarate dehydrogenase complex dihydrolipoamide dehydrogenase (E3) component